MRTPFVLALAAAILVAAAPLVPAASNPLFESITGSEWTCSLLGIAWDSQRAPGERRRRIEGVPRGGCGLRMLFDSAGERRGFDGRLECASLFALALLAGAAAFPRWTRHGWIVAVLLLLAGAWAWRRLRADIVTIVRDLPGGLESLPRWFRPWPWLLVGAAALLLGAASAWSILAARRARPALESTKRIFE